MLEALLLGALAETLSPGTSPVACSFPAATADEPAIELVLIARPSLKDLPGLHRVEMSVNGAIRLQANAQPIVTTEGQDVLVRATLGDTTHYTVGIDAEGRAALNVMVEDGADEAGQDTIRTGHCRNHERYIERWSAL